MVTHAKTAAGSSGARYTATPLKEAAAKAFDRPGLDSEFCRPGDCNRLFGLKRGFVYGLEKAGLIRTVSLRQPGQIKGVKLINVASVRAFLHAQMDKVAISTTAEADSPAAC